MSYYFRVSVVSPQDLLNVYSLYLRYQNFSCTYLQIYTCDRSPFKVLIIRLLVINEKFPYFHLKQIQLARRKILIQSSIRQKLMLENNILGFVLGGVQRERHLYFHILGFSGLSLVLTGQKGSEYF